MSGAIAMTVLEILREVEALSPEDQERLLELIENRREKNRPKRDLPLNTFRGVGAELRDMDAQEYVDQLRAEWDDRP
jgi:hypothetical protein